jgi:hypothetical protein
VPLTSGTSATNWAVAKPRPSVPEATKVALRAQAGGKCANPGCPALRTHLHHIHEWAVYQSHDGEHMIAICPTCHDAIHTGQMRITDDVVRRWKSLSRTDDARRGHVYVEPSRQAKLLLGSIAVTGDAGLLVFQLSSGNTLSFALKDEEIILLSLKITDRRRREVVRLVDGYVRVSTEDVHYETRPGRHVVSAPMQPRYLPKWACMRIQRNEPGFAQGERTTLLDLEVLAPGLVRVQGVWMEDSYGTVITSEMIHFVQARPELQGSIAMCGAGADTVLHYTGPITTALFGFDPTGSSALDVSGRRGSWKPPHASPPVPE